ncbi:MAG: tyrosine-protein phosphatase [Ruminiclostridium sp.]
MYVDFHSHILPGIDDGAENEEMSLKMLGLERKSGVTGIAATPHFYMSKQMTLEGFLEKRSASFESIRQSAEDLGIEIICGAEVYYTPSLADIDLKKLCIGDTDYMMIELPYQNLSRSFIRSFKSFIGSISSDITPILAHAERYLSFTSEESLYDILDSDMLVQLNCGSFKAFSKSLKFMLTLIRHGSAHLLGTDCHNITTRPPNMDMARKTIEKKLSADYFDILMDNARRVFAGERPE